MRYHVERHESVVRGVPLVVIRGVGGFAPGEAREVELDASVAASLVGDGWLVTPVTLEAAPTAPQETRRRRSGTPEPEEG